MDKESCKVTLPRSQLGCSIQSLPQRVNIVENVQVYFRTHFDLLCLSCTKPAPNLQLLHPFFARRHLAQPNFTSSGTVTPRLPRLAGGVAGPGSEDSLRLRDAKVLGGAIGSPS